MQLKSLLPAAALAASVAAQTPDLAGALAANVATLSSLSALLATQPGLITTLSAATNITILAPSNAALIAFLNSTAGAAAANDPAAVAALLTYHVLNGSYPASAFTNTSQFIPSLLTNTSYANVTGGQVVGARLDDTSVELISGLLSESEVTTADVAFTGGVIHVIDSVLTIPQSASSTAVAAGLSGLAGALTTADLVDTVDGLTDVTIFAPSNAAFSAIGSAVANLTVEQLSSILTYHVVQGTVGYSSILTNTTLTTVNGADVTISIVDGEVYVNSARVITPDVLIAGGVVHVIDEVLNPNNTVVDTSPTSTSVAFPGATSASGGGTPFTSGVAIPSPAIATTSFSAFAGQIRAVPTGAVGMGALFGGAALVMANL